MRKRYQEGIGWGEAKQELFEVMDNFLEEPRELYNDLMSNPKKLDLILQDGAEKARHLASPFLQEIRGKIGISRF